MSLRHSPPPLPPLLVTVGILCGFAGGVIDAANARSGAGRSMLELGLAVFMMGSLMQVFLWCAELFGHDRES